MLSPLDRRTAETLPYDRLADELAAVLQDPTVQVPERLVMPLPGNASLFVMPASDARVAMGKLISFTPANSGTPRPTIQGDVLVFDVATGARVTLLDGPTVTARRTAALSLLAARHLAACPQGPALIVGAGVQGRAHLEAFAQGPYASALLQGDRLPAGLFDSIAHQVAAYTGLGVDLVKRSRLRVRDERFFKALLRDQGLTTARLDSRFVGLDADDAGETAEDDASYTAMAGAFKAGIQQVLAQQFGWSGEAPYHLLAPLYKTWRFNDHENKYLSTGPLLRDALHRDPHLRVYVASGYYDLATPHAAGDHSLAHLGLRPGVRERLQVRYFEAGHMMYLHAPSRQQMIEDLRRFLAPVEASL